LAIFLGARAKLSLLKLCRATTEKVRQRIGKALHSMAKVTILSEKTGFHHVQYRKDAYFCKIDFFVEL
jgi:hypothetical protein